MDDLQLLENTRVLLNFIYAFINIYNHFLQPQCDSEQGATLTKIAVSHAKVIFWSYISTLPREFTSTIINNNVCTVHMYQYFIMYVCINYYSYVRT